MFRLGLCHAFGDKARHAGVGVKPCTAGFAAIHNHANIGQRQRGFGNRRGKHDLAALHWGQGGALGGKIHRAKQGADDAIRGKAARKQPLNTPNFAFAGQKHQKATANFAAVFLGLQHKPGQGRLEPHLCVGWPGQPAGFHRERAALRCDHWGIAHQFGNRGRIQRGRHHKDHQVGADGTAHLQRKRKPQIGVQAAFMEFVENQGRDAVERWVGLDHPGEDAFGDNLDPRRGGNSRFTAHPVADGLAHRFTQTFCHPFGGPARGKAARFQHQDTAFRQAQRCVMGQHIQRHARGFASPRRRLQYGHAYAGQGIAQGGQGVVDGKGAVAVHPGLIAVLPRACHMVLCDFAA